MTFIDNKSEYRDEFSSWFQQEAKHNPERAKALLCNDCREALAHDGARFCDECFGRLRKAYAGDWALMQIALAGSRLENLLFRVAQRMKLRKVTVIGQDVDNRDNGTRKKATICTFDKNEYRDELLWFQQEVARHGWPPRLAHRLSSTLGSSAS